MKVIGITGGIGSGKSTVLSLLEQQFHGVVIQADEVAKDLMKKGQQGYTQVIAFFGEEIIGEDGEIDRSKLSAIVFSNANKRMVLNSIVHPLVKRTILEKINELRIEGACAYAFIEAALLIEDHYDVICDELWYIFTPEPIRRERLKESRQYSDEKITEIFQSQLSETEFRKACSQVIDNGGSVEDTFKQLLALKAAMD